MSRKSLWVLRHSQGSFALVFVACAVSPVGAQLRVKPTPPADVREICSIPFDKDALRPARVQNNALPCLKQAATLLQSEPNRKLVLVGVKDPAKDHEPASSMREEEDATGLDVRLEDLSAYRAVNTKWYLVHYLHLDPKRILPTTDESYFAQTVTFYSVPGSADFHHNFLNTTTINELPCTITPCYSPDEETLKAQVRGHIVEGAPESAGASRAEKRAFAAQRQRATPGMEADGKEETLAPLPPLPTPDKPATTSIIPR